MSLAVPRLLRLDITKRWTKDPSIWAPQKLLAGDDSYFPPSFSLSVKRSAKSRFFMYEEHAGAKLDDEDGPTEVMQVSPTHFADILNRNENENRYDKTKHHHHHYCTFPVANVAPGLLTLLNDYEKLYDHDNRDDDHAKANVPQHPPMIDPRGPSLWMGTNNSSTQAHYDVADNIICQLHGTKRVRCYSPKAASALHVFPDAHPRARKSQVNFDGPDLERFPYFSSLAPPDLDVVLEPGCALFIPAFWFHHVENGSEFESSELESEHEFSSGSVISSGSIGVGRPGPSVSVNLFSLSRPMMVAQNIFRDASRPLRSSLSTSPSFDFAATVLHALSWKLMKDLNMYDSDPRAFIQRHLLDTRYTPLATSIAQKNHNIGYDDADVDDDADNGYDNVDNDDGPLKRVRADLTGAEKEMISSCIARILPQFESLREEDDGHDCEGGDAGCSRDEDDGVVSLVLCHLFELWAVELVGASSVEEVWKAAILLAED